MSAEFCSKKQQTMSSITDLTFIDQNNGKFKKYIFCLKSLKSLQFCGYARTATGMDGTLHTDFPKSETSRDIKKYFIPKLKWA